MERDGSRFINFYEAFQAFHLRNRNRKIFSNINVTSSGNFLSSNLKNSKFLSSCGYLSKYISRDIFYTRFKIRFRVEKELVEIDLDAIWTGINCLLLAVHQI